MEPSTPTWRKIEAHSSRDATWVEQAWLGNREAEESLYRAHAPAALRLAKRLVRLDADAQDVVQDTFVMAFRDLHKLREPAAFAGWLRRILIGRTGRLFRRRRWQARLGLSEPVSSGLLHELRGPVSPEVRAALAAVDEQLTAMPAKERTAWALRFVEGCSLAEVADACACSLATAKRRIASAQSKLRLWVDEEDRA